MDTQGSPIASLIPATQENIKANLYTPTPTLAVVTPTKKVTYIHPSVTSTLPACMKVGGRVELEYFATDLLPEPLVYHIYLPPCYDEETDRYFPILYLVHGKNSTDSQWVNLGVPDTLDRLVAKDDLPPFLTVMPRDRKWYEPTVDNFELAVVQSLVPWADEHYRTLPERKYRAISGLSTGSAWALHIGLSHPELFSAVGIHSGVVFTTDIATLHQWLNSFSEGMTPRIYMDIGDKDQPEILMEATWVESQITKFDIRHEWHLYEGRYDEDYWGAHVEEYLRWYSQDWGSEPALNNR